MRAPHAKPRSRTPKPGYELLTEDDKEHAARLCWRCSESQLAALLGLNDSTLHGALHLGRRLHQDVIARLRQLTREDVPSKKGQAKPKHGQRVGPFTPAYCGPYWKET